MPGMQRALSAGKKYKVAPIEKMVGPLVPTRYQSGYGFNSLQALLIALLSFLTGLAVAYYGRTVANVVVDGVKGSPLDIKLASMNHTSPLESFTGLWTMK